ITFDTDTTIVLTATKVISSDTTIDGSGHNVTISGNRNVGDFYVNPGVHLTLLNITVANGFAISAGGGICNSNGIVALNNCTFSNNVASGNANGYHGYGGAIYNLGTLIINNSAFELNWVAGGTGVAGYNGSGEYGSGGTGGTGGNGLGGAIFNNGNL